MLQHNYPGVIIASPRNKTQRIRLPLRMLTVDNMHAIHRAIKSIFLRLDTEREKLLFMKRP